jgi:hypothetical protein
MVIETRARWGERLGIQAVAAFRIRVGTLACSIKGALAMMLGENTKPVRRSTFSRTINSCTAVLATSPPGPLESRLISSIW